MWPSEGCTGRSCRVPAVEQASWSGLHMLGSWVQPVGVAPLHGGQLGAQGGGGPRWSRVGPWEMLEGGSCSSSIVPGGQELSRTQQESGGPFLKSDQLELLFLTPRSLYPPLYLLLALLLPSSPTLHSAPLPSVLGRLIH